MKAWISALLAIVLLLTLCVSLPRRELPAMAQADHGFTLVIDAGHGGFDGGTTADGVRESDVNLAIALRTEQMAALCGIPVRMIRRDDTAVASAKAADLQCRVRLVEQTEHPVLLSIHQNHFAQEKYHGAQVFYGAGGSKALAERMQDALRNALDPSNHRKCKVAENVYLLKNVSCPAVLVECGFLSNARERQLLGDETYQKKLAAAMISVVAEAGRNESYDI